MQSQNCYIEFDIFESKNFDDLKNAFNLVKEAKNKEQPQTDQFWINNLPDYFLRQFYFGEDDIKPKYKTADLSEFTWHFYSLISLLQRDYDIYYEECFKISSNQGRLEYNPFGYPYGGITGLVTFINSFNCKPTIFDDGTGVYKITFKNNGDFIITNLIAPTESEVPVEKSFGIKLLRKLSRLFKL